MGPDGGQVVAAHQAATWQVVLRLCARLCLYDLRRCAVRPAAPPIAPDADPGRAGRGGAVLRHLSAGNPGGWQLIGRTEVPMWDLSRDPPALLRPACCRFAWGGKVHPRRRSAGPCRRGLRIVSTAAFRWSFRMRGGPGRAGRGSRPRARWIWGAAPGQPCGGQPAGDPGLEITLGRCACRPTGRCAGADRGRDGAGRGTAPSRPARPLRWTRAICCRSTRRRPGCAAIWLRGGYDVAPVLGSAATDTLAFVGPPRRNRRGPPAEPPRHRRRRAPSPACPARRSGELPVTLWPAHRLVHARDGPAFPDAGMAGHAAKQPRRHPLRANCR